MVKNIHLHLDEKFFYKMKNNKSVIEKTKGHNITWEAYIEFLFGIKK